MGNLEQHSRNFETLCDAIVASINFLKKTDSDVYQNGSYRAKLIKLDMIRESYHAAASALDAEFMNKAKQSAVECFDKYMLATPAGALYKRYVTDYSNEEVREPKSKAEDVREALFRASRNDLIKTHSVLSEVILEEQKQNGKGL